MVTETGRKLFSDSNFFSSSSANKFV